MEPLLALISRFGVFNLVHSNIFIFTLFVDYFDKFRQVSVTLLRIRHITTGRYLGVDELANEKFVQLLHRDKACYINTAFIFSQNKDTRKQTLDEKEEEGMGVATIRYGETNAFIKHIEHDVWLV